MKIHCIKLHYILMNKRNVYYTVLHVCYIWQIKMDCVMQLMRCTTHMAIGLTVSHAAGFKLAMQYWQFLGRNSVFNNVFTRPHAGLIAEGGHFHHLLITCSKCIHIRKCKVIDLVCLGSVFS